LNVLRKRLSNLERAVKEQRPAFSSSVIVVEDRASGTQLIQDFIEVALSMIAEIE
jgi:hypothetical protein